MAISQSREPRGHAVAKSVAEMVGGCYRQPFANGFESSGIYAADGEMKAGMTGEEVSNTAACHQAGLSHPMSPLASIKRQLSGEPCSLSMQLKGIFWWVGDLVLPQDLFFQLSSLGSSFPIAIQMKKYLKIYIK